MVEGEAGERHPIEALELGAGQVLTSFQAEARQRETPNSGHGSRAYRALVETEDEGRVGLVSEGPQVELSERLEDSDTADGLVEGSLPALADSSDGFHLLQGEGAGHVGENLDGQAPPPVCSRLRLLSLQQNTIPLQMELRV